MTPTSPQICFILGMMPRSGTNWLHDIILQSEHVGDIGPIWEDNVLTQLDGVHSAADQLVHTWNEKWKAGEARLDSVELSRQLKYELEGGVERFLQHQFRWKSCKTGNPKWLLLKSPNSWQASEPIYLLEKNVCIIITRNPFDLIASGIRSFGWNVFGACIRYNAATKAICGLMEIPSNVLRISYEQLLQDLDGCIELVYSKLGLAVPTQIDFSALHLRGQSKSNTGQKVTWSKSELTTADKSKLPSSSAELSSFQRAVIHTLCSDSATQLGYPVPTMKVNWLVRNTVKITHWIIAIRKNYHK